MICALTREDELGKNKTKICYGFIHFLKNGLSKYYCSKDRGCNYNTFLVIFLYVTCLRSAISHRLFLEI